VSNTLLFLLGGSAAFDAAAQAFVPAAGGRDAMIALLIQGGSGCEKYVPEYTGPWARRGASQYQVVAPDKDGKLDLDAASAKLRRATGIFIGGGHTPTYHRLYATEPIRSIIRERYNLGVPVAGCSAGALIAPQIAVLTSDETGDDSIHTPAGLGLASGLVVGVHFTELNALPYLLEAMVQTHTRIGWGIDDPACAAFENGRFKGSLGQFVHEIKMTDFETKTYTTTKCAEPSTESGL